MVALVWFGLAAYVFAGCWQFQLAARAATAQGHFVCGTGAPSVVPGIAAAFAGFATIGRQRLAAALIGIPAAACIALQVLATHL